MSYCWVLYIDRMGKWFLWWPNSEILKISNFGHGRWLGPNDRFSRPWFKEKRYYFCKDVSYDHDLHINRMWKWLFWKAKSENLKLQNFGRVRSIEQNDRWFRSYMTQKSFKILYEFPLWLCFLMYENDKMIVLRVDLWNFINIEFLVFQIAVLKPSLFYAILQKGTWEGYM